VAAAEGEKNRPFTAIVCDYDPIWHTRTIARVRDHGFEVLGEATNLVDALRISKDLKPSLVVTSNEHYGLTALEAIRNFREQPHQPEVLVLSTSQVDRHVFLDLGALLLVGRYDNDAFDRALEEAKEFLTTGERRKADRRTNGDRRVRQDWRTVTKERRGTTDRRQAQRRAAAVHAAADASVPVPPPTRPIGPEEQEELDLAAAAKVAAELAAGAVARAVRGMSGVRPSVPASAPSTPSGPVRRTTSTPAARTADGSGGRVAPAAAAHHDPPRAPSTAADLERVLARAVARANEIADAGDPDRPRS
jgi:DNA-binding NarL/FixJ family response regulator